MTNQPKQKTAIRQAINILKNRYDVYPNIELRIAIKLLKKLEPVNEQQIKDTFNEGQALNVRGKLIQGEHYFNETFEKP